MELVQKEFKNEKRLLFLILVCRLSLCLLHICIPTFNKELNSWGPINSHIWLLVRETTWDTGKKLDKGSRNEYLVPVLLLLPSWPRFSHVQNERVGWEDLQGPLQLWCCDSESILSYLPNCWLVIRNSMLHINPYVGTWNLGGQWMSIPGTFPAP